MFFSSLWGAVSSRKPRSRPSSGTKSSTFWTWGGASAAGPGSVDRRGHSHLSSGRPCWACPRPYPCDWAVGPRRMTRSWFAGSWGQCATTWATRTHLLELLPGLTWGRRGCLGSWRAPEQPRDDAAPRGRGCRGQWGLRGGWGTGAGRGGVEGQLWGWLGRAGARAPCGHSAGRHHWRLGA